MTKRSWTIEEKINECLDNYVKNLHPKFRDELYQLLLNNPDVSNSIIKSKQFICKTYNFPDMGKNRKRYWLVRGWNEIESIIKASQNNNRKPGLPSPFSKEFWLDKINPTTNQKYTEEEANYKRCSQIPTKKEHYLKKGFTEEESIELARIQKEKNNKNGAKTRSSQSKEYHRAFSHRCKDYYILRGFTEEEAIQKIADKQVTFSLDICIEKHGLEEGTKIWKLRQENWQNTLNSKSEEEKQDINRRKVAKVNYKTLWNNELDTPGILYLLKLYKDDEILYKIGVTTKSVSKRYNGNRLAGYSYEIIKTFEDTIHKCFLMEQKIIKDNVDIKYIPSEKFEGWTECFINEPII